MEISVWMQQPVKAVTYLLSLFVSWKNPQKQVSGGASPVVPASDADITSTLSSTPTLVLERMTKTSEAIFGKMSWNNKFICLTLENLALSIPTGSYGLGIYNSPHAGHLVPILKDVPGRDFVEIHCGNVPEDSKGCILVGSSHIGDTLEGSLIAFNLLFPLISSAVYSGVDVRLVLTDS